jgi:tetratricopeptide (TPR) repeat protein
VNLDARLLGDLQIRHDGVPLTLGGQRQQCILAVLLLSHGRTVSRADLAARAWPCDPPDTVSQQIANYVSALRRALAPAGDRIRLLARHPGFTALTEPGLLDTERFAALVGQARKARTGQEHDIAADRLRDALALCGGRPLGGLDTPYLRQRAEALDTERRAAAALLAQIEQEAGRPAEAAAVLRELLAEQPGSEAVIAALVRALTAAGQGTEAADLASRAERSLNREGRTPTPALRQAHSDALAGRVPGGPVRPAGPRHQLPTDTATFTGRDDELGELLALADRAMARERPGTVVISAIDGMAGIGKTALAIHAGHRLVEQFPDGQLFIDLHGYTRDLEPRDPADALAGVLRDLGIPPRQIPADLDALAALYRDRLCGTRTLILLDNAAAEAQVRPLLPGHAGCLVVITSRRRLKGLDDAQPLSLDVLPVPAAISLFRAVAGTGRVPANDPLLAEIVGLCHHLPLALRIAAALFRNRPAWTMHHLAGKLSASRCDLTPFSDGDRDLQSVFDLSCQALDSDQQQLFRRLGLIPGPDTDLYAAAALLGVGPSTAERLLQDLVDDNLLAEPTPGRYQMHDLIRRHARALAAGDPAGEHEAALEQLVDYYQHAAGLADAHMARGHRPGPGPGQLREPAISDPQTAHAWLRAERANLEGCIAHAADHGQDKRLVALTAGLTTLLRRDGPWSRALAMHTAASAAAARLGDQPGQASALHALGLMRMMNGDCQGAVGDLRQALMMHQDLGNRLGQAAALDVMGQARRLAGDYPGAVGDLRQALALQQEAGDQAGQGSTLAYLGQVRRLTGDRRGAQRDQQEALGLSRSLGDRRGQANALTELGLLRRLAGDCSGAVRDQQEALGLFQDLGDLLGQANALTNLGTLKTTAGDYPDAVRELERALGLHQDLGSPLGEASALIDLAEVARLTGDYEKAEGNLRRALGLCRDLGSRLGQAVALTHWGQLRLATGDYENALRDLGQALELSREIAARGAEASALNHYAAVLAATGEESRALALYRDALRLAREVGQPDDEALALAGIGECLAREGDTADGVAYLSQAEQMFRRLGMRPDAERVRRRLAELSSP